MKKRIVCRCNESFEVEVPESINLDVDTDYIQQIVDGNFMSFNCPSCPEKVKPEFNLSVQWPSKQLVFDVLPESERFSFYHRKEFDKTVQTLIGYPELSERVLVLRENLEPVLIEAIKYYLLVKAEEANPESEIEAWFQGFYHDGDTKFLEFHLHGIRKDEVAVSRIPYSVYEKTKQEYKNDPDSEPFASLRFESYLSIQNLLRPEELT